jgi:hypothetical protein
MSHEIAECLKKYHICKRVLPSLSKLHNMQRAQITPNSRFEKELYNQIGYITARQITTGKLLVLFPYCKNIGYVLMLHEGEYTILPREDAC